MASCMGWQRQPSTRRVSAHLNAPEQVAVVLRRLRAWPGWGRLGIGGILVRARRSGRLCPVHVVALVVFVRRVTHRSGSLLGRQRSSCRVSALACFLLTPAQQPTA